MIRTAKRKENIILEVKYIHEVETGFQNVVWTFVLELCYNNGGEQSEVSETWLSGMHKFELVW